MFYTKYQEYVCEMHKHAQFKTEFDGPGSEQWMWCPCKRCQKLPLVFRYKIKAAEVSGGNAFQLQEPPKAIATYRRGKNE